MSGVPNRELCELRKGDPETGFCGLAAHIHYTTLVKRAAGCVLYVFVNVRKRLRPAKLGVQYQNPTRKDGLNCHQFGSSFMFLKLVPIDRFPIRLFLYLCPRDTAPDKLRDNLLLPPFHQISHSR